MDFEIIEQQIKEKQRSVDYDVKEYPVEIMVQKFLHGIDTDTNEIFVPAYQRAFVWDELRQSKFIESVILGLPIPYIFTAEMNDGRLEIVDGCQRIRTLAAFISNRLRLNGLEILDKCNSLIFADFEMSRQRKFKNSSLRMIVLSAKSDEDARYMLFERINTGSELLKDMEKRKGIYQGVFTDFLYECSTLPLFAKLTRFTEVTIDRGEPQELLVRFFAYSEKYHEYRGNVNDFMNEYIKEKNIGFPKEEYLKKLNDMLTFVDKHFPNGFLKASHHTSTPRVRFEAISVGVSLALGVKPDLTVDNVYWIDSPEFENEITGSSTNIPKRLKSRIEFVKSKLLQNE